MSAKHHLQRNYQPKRLYAKNAKNTQTNVFLNHPSNGYLLRVLNI